jgi:hypothetical protein
MIVRWNQTEYMYQKYLAGGNWVQVEYSAITAYLATQGAVWWNPTEQLPFIEVHA